MNIRSVLAQRIEAELSSESPNWLLRMPLHEYEQVKACLEPVIITPRNFRVGGGQALSHVYFPYSGVVSVVARMKTGEAAEVATVGRYGMVGISVLLDADPAPYDMVCHIPGVAGRIRASEFMQLLDRFPQLRVRLQHYALCLFHEAARTAACNRLHSVEQRLARWLLLCSDQAGVEVYPLTHEALARMLGVGRTYITRTAHDLQQHGIVQYRHGTLRILDRHRLEACACEDYHTTKQEYRQLLR